jgi:hypothetical protein
VTGYNRYMAKKNKVAKINKDTKPTKIDDELLNFVVNTEYCKKPSEILDNLQAAIAEHSDSTSEDTELAVTEAYRKAVYAYSLDNHVEICNVVNEMYRPLVISMSENLLEEFKCTTTHEKALVHMIASAYVRYIQYSSRFMQSQDIDFLSSEKTQYYTMYGKEADRAHRQFTTALTTLRQLKAPTPTITVKAKNAIVAQNQQINAVRRERGR